MVSNDPETLDLRQAVVLVCVLFTAITLVSSSSALVAGLAEDSHEYLVLRFAVTVLGVGAFHVHGRLRRVMARAPSLVVGAVTYAIAMGAAFVIVWSYGLFRELYPDAYRDTFFNFTAAFVVIAAVQTSLVDGRRRREASRSNETPSAASAAS